MTEKLFSRLSKKKKKDAGDLIYNIFFYDQVLKQSVGILMDMKLPILGRRLK
jgi:hypothetical protein